MPSLPYHQAATGKRVHQPFNQLFEGFKVRGLNVVGSVMFSVSPPLGCPDHCIADLIVTAGESYRTASAGFFTAAVLGKVPPSTSERVLEGAHWHHDLPEQQACYCGKARQGKARQGKARQGKARQGKARQGKARQGKQHSTSVPGFGDSTLGHFCS
jgi:hypothetical protein